MKPIRSFHAATRVALGLACAVALAALPAAARAQAFAEFGGGLAYPGPAPDGHVYSRGYGFRASVGHQLEPRVRVRFDATFSWFDDRTQFYPPCAFPGCTGPSYNVDRATVAGLSANWLVDVDRRGILYGIGGAGLYDVDADHAKVALDVSAGAGISVPIRAGLRAIVEARYHIPFGTTAELPWIVPVTFGVRF